MGLTAAVCGIVFGTILGILFGAILAWIFTRKNFEKQLKENPPITEEQLRIMYSQMGRKPTEKQIKQIMYNMKNPKK